MNIYLHPSGVKKELKNAYIGEYKGFVPGSNTFAYFPFQNDSLDHSGNGHTLSASGTKTTIGYNFTTGSEVIGGATNVLFTSCWVKLNSASGNTALKICGLDKISVSYYPYATSYLNNKFAIFYNSSWNYQLADGPSNVNTWHHICYGYDGSKTIYAIDGVVSTLYNGKGYDYGYTSLPLIQKDSGVTMSINMSDVIFETACWTSDEIKEYYNQTKSNYGL